MKIDLPKEYPCVLLLSLCLFGMQDFVWHKMMKRQSEIFARRSFMSDFKDEHTIAFDTEFGKSTEGPDHPSTQPPQPNQGPLDDLPSNFGLPQEGNYGWYSKGLSYREWHRLECASLAYKQLQSEVPTVVFSLLIGSSVYPQIGFLGISYFIGAAIKSYLLFADNGIK